MTLIPRTLFRRTPTSSFSAQAPPQSSARALTSCGYRRASARSTCLRVLLSLTTTLAGLADTVAPTLLSASGSCAFDRVTVRFSEPVDPVEAIDVAHYALSGGLTISAASLPRGSRATVVVLQTSLQTPGSPYTVTVNGIHDRAATPNEIAPDSQVMFTAFVLSTGYLQREAFFNLPGSTVADLTNAFRFPNEPGSVSFVSQFEAPSGFAENYGVRLHGFLLPPVTGDYVFYLCADDQGALFLSPDEDPAKRIPIIELPDWTPWRAWGIRGPPSISSPIHLVAGQRYYVAALMKDSAISDNLAVSWQLPGTPPPARGDPPISSSFLAVGVEDQTVSLRLVDQPESLTVGDHQPAHFDVRAVSSSPDLLYQWQRNGTDIPGAIGSGHDLPVAESVDSGVRFRCVVTVPGAKVVSDEATLTVESDTAAPALVSAEGSIGLNHITVTFTEPIDPVEATNPTNYQVSGGVVVFSARLHGDQRSVSLETSPQTSAVEYTLTVNGIRDTSSSANLIASDTSLQFIAWVPEEFMGPFPSWADVKRDYGAVGDGIADDTAPLQRALDEVATAGHSHVVFLPSGTYRITEKLVLLNRGTASIFGEDPATTSIRWDGPPGEWMMHWDGVGHSRLGRLTFDGNGVADTAVAQKYRTLGWPPTRTEYADLVFKDVGFGLRAGDGSGLGLDSEGTILRCHFLRCSEAGVSIESYNALDWFIWHSHFEDCRYGAMNHLGSGHYHVYGSLFERSTEADASMANCSGYFSLRDNTSRDSQAFFLATGPIGCPGNITLQRNTIIDPINPTPILIGNLGPLLLIDNVIRSRADASQGPVVWLHLHGAQALSIGNTFTTSNNVEVSSGGRLVLDDRVVDRDTLDLPLPELPGPLPNFQRHIIEVPAGSGAAAIQAAIDEANTRRGTRPIVHLPAGEYLIDRTVTIPAGCDVQLVGDGFLRATILGWVGAGDGPVLRLEGPSRATLRNFYIHCQERAMGVVVENADQAGARVYVEQSDLFISPRHNLLVDRLDSTEVSLQAIGHGGAAQSSVQVIGGARQSRREPTDGRVAIFGGSGGSATSYEVRHGGQLLVQDFWDEGGPGVPVIRLDDSGRFTLHGGLVAPAAHVGTSGANGGVRIADFRGDAAFLAAQFTATTIDVQGQGDQTRLLLLGIEGLPLGAADDQEPFLRNESPEAQVRLLQSFRAVTGGGSIPLLDRGSLDPEFLRSLLSQTREQQPRRLTPRPNGVTDVRIFGISVEKAIVGFKLTGVNAVPTLNAVPEQWISEGSTLVVTNVASDPDLPFNLLTFTLGPGAPDGLGLNPTNGVLTWTPSEAQSPSKYEISVIVTDDGSPPLSDTNIFQITVAEANTPPLLLGVIGTVTNSTFDGALDVGVPGNPLEPGSTTVNPDGTITVVAGGLGDWKEADYLHFAYQEVVGDFDVSVRGGIPYPDQFRHLYRVDDAREPGARQPAAVYGRDRCWADTRWGWQPAGHQMYESYCREATGQPTVQWKEGGFSGGVPYPDAWIRLQRQGQTFTAYRGTDGLNWTQYGRTTGTAPYPDRVLVGLCTTSRNNGPGWTTIAQLANYRNIHGGYQPIGDRTVDEGSPLSFAVKATDPDLPAQGLTFSLEPGAPDGASMDPDHRRLYLDPDRGSEPRHLPDHRSRHRRWRTALERCLALHRHGHRGQRPAGGPRGGGDDGRRHAGGTYLVRYRSGERPAELHGGDQSEPRNADRDSAEPDLFAGRGLLRGRPV